MLDFLQHTLMLTSRHTSRRLVPMHIPLSPTASVEIIILSPLQCHLRNHIGIARGDGILVGFQAWGVDVACAASL